MRRVPSLSAKALDERQTAALMENDATANPLYLLVALEELRGFGSYEQLNDRIAAFPRMPTPEPGPFQPPDRSVPAIFDQVLERLEEDFDTGLVWALLSYLGSARNGLLERDLGSLLRDHGGAQDFFPVLRQLRPYLFSRGGLLDFYHRSFRAAVQARYLRREKERRNVHERMAAFFLDSPDPNRGAPELIWHLVRARRYEEFQAIATEPHLFISYWRNDPELLLECWAQVERGSPLSTVEAYASLLAEPPVHPEAVGPVCELFISLGHHADCAAALRSRVARLREARDWPELLSALGQLGAVCKELGDSVGLSEVIREQAAIETEGGGGQTLFSQAANLAHVAQAEGDLSAALAIHQEIEEAARKTNDRSNLHVAMGNRANLLLRQGQIESALALAREAVEVARQLGDARALAHHLAVEGDVLVGRQDLREALARYDQAEVLCRRFGNRRMLAHVLFKKAAILFHEGTFHLALPCAREAHTLFAHLKRPQEAEKALRLLEDIRGALNGRL